MAMKTKLNLTIDEELVPVTKEYASRRGMSLSQLVEELLREVTSNDGPTFSDKWRGRFKPSKKEGPRYEKLKKRLLQ
jgi:hypothetical protein